MSVPILVADDDENLVDLIKISLKKEGYKIIPTYDGQQALEKIKKTKPRLVILDIGLPTLDGYNVCYKLKQEKIVEPRPKIIMLTAWNRQQDKKLGQSVGADAYITKPFIMENLLAKVKELLKEDR